MRGELMVVRLSGRRREGVFCGTELCFLGDDLAKVAASCEAEAKKRRFLRNQNGLLRGWAES